MRAVYWLARMIHGGEDPKFIARRMLIFASEDVGNADPQALLVAHAAFKAAESIGWPECRINLSQAAVYLALAPKSNASYLAIDAALDEVRTGPARCGAEPPARPTPPRCGRVRPVPVPARRARGVGRPALPAGRPVARRVLLGVDRGAGRRSARERSPSCAETARPDSVTPGADSAADEA